VTVGRRDLVADPRLATRERLVELQQEHHVVLGEDVRLDDHLLGGEHLEPGADERDRVTERHGDLGDRLGQLLLIGRHRVLERGVRRHRRRSAERERGREGRCECDAAEHPAPTATVIIAMTVNVDRTPIPNGGKPPLPMLK